MRGEYRFCLIMWEHEPISAAQLVKLCQGTVGMEANHDLYRYQTPRGTRRTENEDGIVTALVSKDEAQAWEIDELVEKEV